MNAKPSNKTAIALAAALLLAPSLGAQQQQQAAAPRVNITSPGVSSFATGSTVISVEVTVASGTEIKQVEFFVDEVSVGTRTAPPWELTWDAGDGFARHVIRVVATDSTGAQGEDTVVTRDLETAAFVLDVDVVPLYVTVTDDRGVYVPGLTKADFEVFENGKRQEIKYFDNEPRPMVIGLMIDTSGSMEGVKMDRAKSGAAAFLEYLGPDDKAFVMGFDAFPHLLADLTPNHGLLRDAIGRMEPRGATSLNMAIVEAADLLVDNAERRALIILSDGYDTVQSVTEGQAIEYAQHQDIRLYTIGIFDTFNMPGTGGFDNMNRGEVSMRAYADGTGGRAFILDSLGELDRAYEEIAAELRSQYSLGYTPATPAGPGEWREIEVKSRRGNARTKPGYYGQ